MEAEDTVTTISPELPIDTERLRLRYFEPSDVEAVAAYCVRAEAQRYLDWKARDPAELRAGVARMCSQRRLHRPGDAVTVAVVRRADDALVGHVSLRWTDATAGQAELRFIFNPLYGRQGYATEGVSAALDLGFDAFGLHRIFARCGAENRSSAKLLKGIGMRLEAHYREHALFQGNWDEELHFAILDREWRRDAKVKDLTQHKVA